MNTIVYKKDLPFFKTFLGVVLIVFGIIYTFSGIFLNGLMALVIGINLILTEGSEINLDNKTYRKIKSFLGINFGKWKPCPKFDYVSVFKTKENQKLTYITASTTFTNEIILLNLFFGNRHITFYKTNNKVDAFRVAEHFKMALDIEILDATGSEKKWL